MRRPRRRRVSYDNCPTIRDRNSSPSTVGLSEDSSEAASARAILLLQSPDMKGSRGMGFPSRSSLGVGR